jgi:murein DD-endopeptidase MepM/ murein hydrolase activator NlpD
VVDPYRAPAHRYASGNRGLEYATGRGTPARSIGPGVVAFAGPVAGRLVVSVVHPGGLRSSLTGLASVVVRVGAVVDGSTVLGVTGDRLHLGVRRGGEYLDPATLFADESPRRSVLVPTR